MTWKGELEQFSTTTLLSLQPKEVQAATFLITIGEDEERAFSTFTFHTEDEKKGARVLKEKFKNFYKPAKNLTHH